MAPRMGEIPPAVFEQFADHYYGVNLLLWIIYMLFLVFMVIVSVRRGRKKENVFARRMEFAFGLFSLGLLLSRVAFIVAIAGFPEKYDFYCSIAYFFGNFGFAFLIASLEQMLEIKRPIFTIFGICATAASALGIIGFERDTILVIVMILEVLMMLLIFGLYLKIIKNTPGTIRKMAIISVLGMIALAVFLFLDGQFVLSNPAFSIYIKRYLAPIGCTFALILLMYGRREI